MTPPNAVPGQVLLPWIHFTDEELEACGHAETVEEAVGMRNFHELGWQVGCTNGLQNVVDHKWAAAPALSLSTAGSSTTSDLGLTALSSTALASDLLLSKGSWHLRWVPNAVLHDSSYLSDRAHNNGFSSRAATCQPCHFCFLLRHISAGFLAHCHVRTHKSLLTMQANTRKQSKSQEFKQVRSCVVP